MMDRIKVQHVDQIERILIPQIRCPSNNKIYKFCTNKDCKFPSLACRQQTCQACSANHEECFFGQFSQLTKRIQRKLAFQETILQQFFTVENDLIDEIKKSRILTTDQNNILKVDSRLRTAYDSIYLSKHDNIVGENMSQLFFQLSLNQLRPQSQKYLDKYRQDLKQITNNLIHIRDKYLESIFQTKQIKKSINVIQRKAQQKYQNQISQNVELLHVSNSTDLRLDSKNSKRQIDSKILGQDSQQKIDYLFKQLKNPSKLQLIFRASENNFEASKFHDSCKNKGATVCVFLTEFNKTIAGYTSLQWIQTGYYVKDLFGDSILLQLDLQEKMSLVNPSRAIYDNRKFGPSFGTDLIICDKCNQNNQSSSNFPSSYNLNNKYKKGCQESRLAFCGAPQDKNFKVIEYQVFKVIYDE